MRPGPSPVDASPVRVLVVFGTRPEAVKMAPLVHELERTPGFEPVVAVTAQHREMLDQVLEVFGIVPHHDLDVQRPRQGLTDVTARSLEGLSAVVERERPDMVVVQGDTTTTFAGALAAFYHHVPVAHVEAGLRTGDVHSPFPEEMNRRLTARLTALHLPPTPVARANLLREGVDPACVVVTGNTVIDALHWAVARRLPYSDPQLERLEADPRPKVLVTAHRRESWGEPMRAIGRAVAEVARREPDAQIVFPIHRNPLVREAIVPAVAGLPNVHLIEPVEYGEFARLMSACRLILTDSGGIQEEGPALGKPVLVMRDTTERPEAVAAGTARLVGTDEARIVASVRELLRDGVAYDAMARAANPFGDGRAAARCVAAMAHVLGAGPPAVEFERAA